MQLENRVAVVTGAARGIGKAIAWRFLQEGAHVVVADIDEDAAAATISSFANRRARFVPCDVGDGKAVARLIGTAEAEFDGIDILVNNAAVMAVADFLDLGEADFDRVLRINLKAAFLTSRAVAPGMIRRARAGGRKGAIINISSVNAEMTVPNQVPYSISKAGLNQLTRVLALSLAPHGIRVNAIGPGSIATEMLASVINNKEARARILSRTPMGRVGEPSEIAAIAAFLASDDASYITGQTIYADGGRMALKDTVPVTE